MSILDTVTLSYMPPTPGWYIYDSDGNKIFDCSDMGIVRGTAELPGGCGHNVDASVLCPVPKEHYASIVKDNQEALWDEVKFEMMEAFKLLDPGPVRCRSCTTAPPVATPPDALNGDDAANAPWQQLPPARELGDPDFHDRHL